ncbi:MAG: type II toxin-antitoxin system RelE/ParE family toxin [Dehalococcoidia bacterium]|nr:type II toxin-antitoxin system RelE/ParE family toxin [Dehalococcoidia bacterium]
MHEIVFTKQADKALRMMPAATAQRIREKLDRIAEDPHATHKNATRLQKTPAFRLRIGDWRVIYEIDGHELRILVLKIGPRGGAYK